MPFCAYPPHFITAKWAFKKYVRREGGRGGSLKSKRKRTGGGTVTTYEKPKHCFLKEK